MNVGRRRPDKRVMADEALASLPRGALLAVGGVLHDNKPIALERALLRCGCKGLRYIALSGSGYDLDLLIAAGAIDEVFVPVVTFDDIGFAPSYRWAVEEKSIVAHMVDVASVMAGYFAGASGIPFHPITAVSGSDVTKHNPLLSQVHWNGGKVAVVPAITPDVALIHAQEADERGNARIYGSTAQAERLLARAAKRVVLSCDRFVPTSRFEEDPHATTIPGMYVDAVCQLPYGAHPTLSPRIYEPDTEHLKHYWKTAETARRANDRANVREYLQKFVYGCRTHDDYLTLVGGAALARLAMGNERAGR